LKESAKEAVDPKEVARLKAQLQLQRDASMCILIGLREKFGADLVQVISKQTTEHWKCFMEKHPLCGARDIKALMASMWDRLPSEFEWECTEETPEAPRFKNVQIGRYRVLGVENTTQRIRVKVTKCPFADEMKKYGAPDIAHALYCAADQGIAAGVNPKIKYTCTKTLMQGHDCCEHCYEM